jgi:hypothetical protein
MALRKDPQRRYVSVEQFAEDIRRHQQNLPVLARKDTLGYRTSKFVTRHQAGLAAVGPRRAIGTAKVPTLGAISPIPQL